MCADTSNMTAFTYGYNTDFWQYWLYSIQTSCQKTRKSGQITRLFILSLAANAEPDLPKCETLDGILRQLYGLRGFCVNYFFYFLTSFWLFGEGV